MDAGSGKKLPVAGGDDPDVGIKNKDGVGRSYDDGPIQPIFGPSEVSDGAWEY